MPFYFVQSNAVTCDKGVVLVHLPEVISDDFMVRTDSGKPSPFCAAVLADGDANMLAHLERLTPLLCKAANAASADATEIPSALATFSGVTRVRLSDLMTRR
jgi:hypothetical protein